jgi:NAD(P)H-dependent FMN reductase
MDRTLEVAVLVGSLRRMSLTRKVANALIETAPSGLRCRVAELGDLPIYNEDLEEREPPAWARFRREVASAQAILFVTPEYNRSIPGGLKNAIDVGSRPPGKSVWTSKPGAIVSVTPYKLGGFGANHALRQALVFLDLPVMQQPEAYVSEAAALFDEQGSLKNQDTKHFFVKFMGAFEKWATALSGSKT